MSRQDQDEQVALQAKAQIAFNEGAQMFRDGRPKPQDPFKAEGWAHAARRKSDG